MGSRIGSATAAGVLAGIVFGVMMQMMTAPTPDGARMPVIAMDRSSGRQRSRLGGYITCSTAP